MADTRDGNKLRVTTRRTRCPLDLCDGIGRALIQHVDIDIGGLGQEVLKCRRRLRRFSSGRHLPCVFGLSRQCIGEPTVWRYHRLGWSKRRFGSAGGCRKSSAGLLQTRHELLHRRRRQQIAPRDDAEVVARQRSSICAIWMPSGATICASGLVKQPITSVCDTSPKVTANDDGARTSRFGTGRPCALNIAIITLCGN